MDMPIPSTDTGAAEGDGLVLVKATAAGVVSRTPVPADLAARLATPAQPEAPDAWDALVHDLAQKIGAAAMRGDIKGMEREQRFHRHIVGVREHYRSGNESPVRLPKGAAKAAA